jgi:hypothetical protein
MERGPHRATLSMTASDDFAVYLSRYAVTSSGSGAPSGTCFIAALFMQ